MCVYLRVKQDGFPRSLPYRFFPTHLSSTLHIIKRVQISSCTHREILNQNWLKGVRVKKSPIAGKMGITGFCELPGILTVFVTRSPIFPKRLHVHTDSSAFDHLPPTSILHTHPTHPPPAIIYLPLIPLLMLQTLILMSHCWIKSYKPLYPLLINKILGNSASVEGGEW